MEDFPESPTSDMFALSPSSEPPVSPLSDPHQDSAPLSGPLASSPLSDSPRDSAPLSGPTLHAGSLSGSSNDNPLGVGPSQGGATLSGPPLSFWSGPSPGGAPRSGPQGRFFSPGPSPGGLPGPSPGGWPGPSPGGQSSVSSGIQPSSGATSSEWEPESSPPDSTPKPKSGTRYIVDEEELLSLFK
jgi:hypothetical protein